MIALPLQLRNFKTYYNKKKTATNIWNNKLSKIINTKFVRIKLTRKLLKMN